MQREAGAGRSLAEVLQPIVRQWRRVMAGGGRKEKGRKRSIGGARRRGKMVISHVGLTLLALNMDGMACM
jgi:hypothetical protein